MNIPLIEYARKGRTLKVIPIFDAHAHPSKWAGFDSVQLEDHIKEMNQIGIDAAAVSSLLALSGEIQSAGTTRWLRRWYAIRAALSATST